MKTFLVILVIVLCPNVKTAPIEPSGLGSTWWRHCSLLDMTYELNSEVIAYPAQNIKNNAFRFETLENGTYETAEGDFYLYYGKYCSVEHFGTHMDAPNHITETALRAENNNAVHQVPLSNLIGEACVIDVPEKEKFKGSNYRLTIADIQKWEAEHGPIDQNCIVIVRTGQEKFWGDRNAYLGTDTPDHTDENGWSDTLAWPGMSVPGARWILKNRGLKAIGVDAISIDAGGVRSFHNSVHTVILGSNRPGLENLARVSRLPARGATLIALPIPITGASGAPLRVLAYGWDGPEDPCRLH